MTPSHSQLADCQPQPATSIPEGPRPLTESGLANLTAFTRLLGYVRHFHPSDQAATADWDRLTIEGLRRVETCDGPEQLAAALAAVFRPVASTVQVFPTGAQDMPPPDLIPPSGVEGLNVVSWRHQGAGQVTVLKPHPLYTSERVVVAASSDSVSADASWIFSTELGAGLTARIPLKLYADAAGTLPHAPPAPAPADGSQHAANDRATRLAAVALAWNVLQHFYPYFDVVDTGWPRALATGLATAATSADEQSFIDTLRRLVAALQDGHGNIFRTSSRELVDHGAHSLPLAWALIEGKLVITHVPAEAAATDLAPGDLVLAIDGQATEEALSRARELISAATPQSMRFDLAKFIGRGPPGSTVRLTVQLWNGVQREVELRRTVSAAIREPRPATVAELEPGIHYFDIDRATDADLSEALPKLADAKAVIFDLRGYPRIDGYLQHLSVETLQSPIWQVPIITQPDRVGIVEYKTFDRWDLAPKLPRLKGRIIFLIDGRAISYAESVMGIVEAYKLADIVGEATAGTNGNPNPFTVPGGFGLTWTGMRVLKHDGSRHHGVGILPTHPVQRTIKAVVERRDEILEKGLELARQPRQ